MIRTLLVQTASPKRVRAKAEEILADASSPRAALTILCAPDREVVRYFSEITGARIVPFARGRRRRIIGELRQTGVDVQHTFWTGERRYRRLRVAGLLIGAARGTRVHIGDGSSFRLTWKAIVRHALFRWQHPLPTDHYAFVPPAGEPAVDRYEGERILVLQSAAPRHVLRALERLRDRSLFHRPQYTLFCRNTPEIVGQFARHPMLHSVQTHAETRGAWKHLLELRRAHYDAAVLFFTGDPSYWKVKCFGFLVGARHKVIFNENNDCFYFTAREWLALLAHRMNERARVGALPRWSGAHQARMILFLTTKLVLLPFRFVWLLLVWLRLRCAARGHEESDVCPL